MESAANYCTIKKNPTIRHDTPYENWCTFMKHCCDIINKWYLLKVTLTLNTNIFYRAGLQLKQQLAVASVINHKG